MANTPSNMLPLGTKAPDFDLLDTVSGQTNTLETLKGEKGTLVMFICNHCPFVIHVMPEIIKMALKYQHQGIAFIAISSNDVLNYPQDAPHLMKNKALDDGYPFPYLFDESQQVARAFNAACTPDFYLFDAQLRLAYRGQLDDSRPGNGIPVTGTDLENALNATLLGQEVNPNQKPSIGCNIKWKVAKN